MRAVLLLCLLLVACEGPQGPEGPQGDAGKPGPAGPAGKDGAPGMSLVVNYSCTGFADFTGTGQGFAFDYQFYAFTDGSAMVTCIVKGGASQATGLDMYKKGMAGAIDGTCTARFDADAASSGYWVFDINSTRISGGATYRDASSQYNNRVYPLSCTPYT